MTAIIILKTPFFTEASFSIVVDCVCIFSSGLIELSKLLILYNNNCTGMDFKTKLPNVFSIVAVHIFASMRNTEKKRYLYVWCPGPKKVDFSSDSRQ